MPQVKLLNALETRRANCIACGSNKIVFWGSKERNEIMFRIDRCKNCGTGFMNPRPSFEYLISEIYSTSGHGLEAPIALNAVLEAEREYPNATRDAKTLIGVALNYLPPAYGSRKALDIGSGYGFFSKEALKAGFAVTAINPGRWENIIFRQLTGLEPVERAFEEVELNESFDLILLNHVLEHMYDPQTVLSKVRRLLAKEGVVAIAVPNFNWILVRLLRLRENGVLWVPEHLNYFTETGLRALLTSTGFKILKVRHVARIPYYAISNRLHLSGKLRLAINSMTRILQWVPMRILEQLKSGITIQVWATPEVEP
jgi:2-polyprenyl-3-methyl-5-hydroxy-6-metoxy-1,4-benzoquinol methylase